MRASANGSSPATLAARSDVAQRMLNPAQTQRPRPHPSPDEGEDALYRGGSGRASPELRVGPDESFAKDSASDEGGPMAAPLCVEEREEKKGGEERRGGEDANIPEIRLERTENGN